MATKLKEVNTESNQDFDFKEGKARMNNYAKRTKSTFTAALKSKNNKKGSYSGRLAGKSLKVT